MQGSETPQQGTARKGHKMKKRVYDLRNIMLKAWEIFRKAAKKQAITFGEALHRAWQAAKAEPINMARIEAAKAAAGITERVRTWYGWKQAGFMVKHGSKNLFQVELIAAAKGDGKTFRQSYFGESQVEPLEAATA